jgi:predicted lipoprotein with Yx(FWY)xxD motif
MRPTRRQFLGAATASAVAGLGGCQSGDGTETPTDSPTRSPAPTDTPAGSDGDDMAAATVAVAARPDHGNILVDGEGRTLYMFDSDTQGEPASTCTDGCAKAWPPLTTEGIPEAGEAVTAELATFERSDGSTQVAANGWPLYYFAEDEDPSDATGQGVSDVWWVLAPDGTPQRATESSSSNGGSSY